jgi:hypothetical protein
MYTNAQYVIGYGGSITTIRCDINGVTNYVPMDDSNTDYRNIMALVAAGELTIAPAS